MKRDFISVRDLTAKEIEEIFLLTQELKKKSLKFKGTLRDKVLALVFEKPSCRTRVSFEVGMFQLGGRSIYLGPEEVMLGKREPVKDIARTLSRYVDAIVIRTFSHNNVLEMAKYATVPVINGLSDLLHPCQALSDIFTIKEKLNTLKGIKIAFIGDGNNVCHSLLYATAILGINMSVASPAGYEPKREILKEAEELAKRNSAVIELFSEPKDAVKDADVVYTDVWTSMGQEKEKKERKKRFKKFQLNRELLKYAKRSYLIMHCLP
ncbi:MAG: ornithine carbamoyltransferase, partial [Candidatus Omnitrophica bacterium]|nr:ornithine carbamoyltransferase [Candidatus Omnitrophota bacterium]